MCETLSSAGRAVRMLVLIVWLCSAAQPAQGGHLSREDPVEPIFTERAFIENDLEFDVDWEEDDDGDTLELALATTWIFWKRLQLGLEVPYGIAFPNTGPSQSSFSDIDLSAKVLLCCETERGFTFVSIRGDAALASGDRSKGIGGEGSFSFSLLGGHGFTVVRSLPDLTVQVQFTYTQQIRPSAEQDGPAGQLGSPRVRENEVDWNIAFTQKLFRGHFSPVFEVLGTSIVDAPGPQEGTSVDLAVGTWVVPFSDEHFLSNLSIGAGWRWPVTSLRTSDGEGLLIFELAFD